ncbi:hypothetical protein Pint_06874 [Pistacia integerrima]|uniref:Uncharacterized protein n=1 Tax=Pistacia integerrima TaxID=434235 RepID=A0ACC0XUD0_9ROSI|nr:hypothetical protein Pint_06874 [Pistacia integerrima]
MEVGEPNLTSDSILEEIQVEAESMIPTQEELMGISLHAIMGAPASKTMRLKGRIHCQTIMVLIDIGSTHSFVDPSIAKKAKLPIIDSQLYVQIANGDNLPCHGCCKAIPIQLLGFQTKATLHLLTLGGYLVLGVDWLRQLGPILWNFIDLTMQFPFNGSTIRLQGIRPSETNLEEEEKISKCTKYFGE